MKESGIGRENGIEAFEACKSTLFDIVRDVRLTYSHQTRKVNLPSSTLHRWRKHGRFKIGLRRALKPNVMDSSVCYDFQSFLVYILVGALESSEHALVLMWSSSQGQPADMIYKLSECDYFA